MPSHPPSALDRDAPIFAARMALADTCAARPAVTHDYAVVAFHTGGHARIEQQGRWTLEAGDVLLIPAGAPHRRVEARGAELWGLGFCVPCISAHGAEGAAELLEPFERVRAGASAVVRIPPDRHAFLESLYRELADAASPARRPTPPAVQRSLLTLVLEEVRRAAGREAVAEGRSLVATSLAFIERHCLGPLTLKDVAKAVGASPAHLTTTLSRATGRSAGAWIIAGRMAEARRLLLHSDEAVDAVAGRVGYADATHFIRMFQRSQGATPAAWRRAQRA